MMTRRYGPSFEGGSANEHQVVLELAKELGVDDTHVMFLDREYKSDLIHQLGVHLLIDDDPNECNRVRQAFSIYNAVCVDSEHNAPSKTSWKYGAESMIRFFVKMYIDK
jgi:hypothetical protein